jgi:hypothetical protein
MLSTYGKHSHINIWVLRESFYAFKIDQHKMLGVQFTKLRTLVTAKVKKQKERKEKKGKYSFSWQVNV